MLYGIVAEAPTHQLTFVSPEGNETIKWFILSVDVHSFRVRSFCQKDEHSDCEVALW